MRLGLLQLAPTGPVTAPDEPLKEKLRELGSAKVDLAILPELLLPGYNQPEAHAARSHEIDGPTCRAMAALAREAGIAIAYGWAERDGEAVYNAASVMDRNGQRLLHYRKMQLFGEMERKSFVSSAQAPLVCDFGGARIGLLICYDIEFPEHARTLARQGCDLLLVPTANPDGFEHVQELLVPARAYENRLTVAYANPPAAPRWPSCSPSKRTRKPPPGITGGWLPPLAVRLGLDRAHVRARALRAHPTRAPAAARLDHVDTPTHRRVTVPNRVGHRPHRQHVASTPSSSAERSRFCIVRLDNLNRFVSGISTCRGQFGAERGLTRAPSSGGRSRPGPRRRPGAVRWPAAAAA